MSLNPEEMNRRRERREAQRKQQEKERRRLKLTLIAACVVLALCGFAIFSIARGASQARANVSAELSAVPETTAPTIQAQTEAATESRNTPTNTVIHLRAAGDLNVTNAIVQSGLSVNGYDFTDAIMDVAAELSCGDVTVLNLEGNICGEPYGTISASAPRELAAALRNAGVDLVQLANSYTVNNGIIGLNQTLQQLRSAGIEPMGAYANDQDYRSAKGYTICNIQGIRVAFVAFTKGLGGMGLPAGNENCVNLLYEDYDSTYNTVDTKKITTILDNVAEEKPDLVVAMLHWGSENSENITASQEKIISLMQKMGVDVILGTHPHLLQKITFDQSAGTLVAYSLGDFLSDAAHDGTNYSIILDVEITKYADSGVTQVTGFSYVPIYTATDTECIAIRQEGARRVLRIREAMEAYDGNFVDRITADAYAKMQYALTRIEERIQGKSQTTTTK